MKNKFSFLIILLLVISSSGFSQITITFTVDIPGMYIGPGGVHIAGQFLSDSSLTIHEDWQPNAAGSQMALLFGTTYTVDVVFPAASTGKPLEFEFVRDSVWGSGSADLSEGNPGDCCLDYTCGVLDGSGGYNRILTIPDCAGEYICSWNNCASLVVSSLPSLTVTPQDTTICTGQSVQLSAVSNGIISWLFNPTLSCTACNNPVASPVSSINYFVTSAIGNCLITDTIVVIVGQPTLSIPDDILLCAGQSVQLIASGNGSIFWSPSSGLSCTLCDDPIASPLSSILYLVSSSIGNCFVKDSIMITVDTFSVNAGSDQNIILGESAQLNASGASNVLWGPDEGLSCTDCSSPIASPSVTTSYIVTSTSDNECKASDTVTIFVTTPCKGIFFPNAFTPNGDGRNDTFGPVSALNPPIKLFSILNRWGQPVFETTDFSQQWDGNFHNKPQPIGTYIYYLELECEGGTTLMKGEITLIR